MSPFSKPMAGCLLCLLVPMPLIAGESIDFQQDVAPILQQHCLQCHSDNIRKGDFSLSSFDDLRDNEFVIPGEPTASHLMELISGDPPAMPKEGEPLTAVEVERLRQWIASGADWNDQVILHEPSKADRSWWSLQPLATFPSGGSIDQFIRRRLSSEQLSMNPLADRRTLIRRATYDLTGLPPTPEEVNEFLRDSDPHAYEKLIDRLLASPEYGQRWGRHWLDVVRFGESNGFERNQIINDLWPFRDYVIDSLNEDKPFDQFVREHLAGDVIGSGNPSVEIGSAFLVAGPYDDVGNQDAVQMAQIRANTIDEMIRTTGEAFLGLTIGCARCHDHKFDPILQQDYYQWYATFAAVKHGRRVSATDQQKASHQARVAPLQARLGELERARAELMASIDRRADQRAEQDAKAWTRPPVDRRGTTETFAPVQARFVRLLVDGRDTDPSRGSGFHVDEFEVWTNDEPSRNVALASKGARASGPSREIEDFPGAYGPQLAIDGQLGARFIARSNFLQIELAQASVVSRVTFSSARDEPLPEQPKFAFVSDYRIEVSLDGRDWTEVADGRDRQPVNEAHRRHRLRALATSPQDAKELANLDRRIGRVRAELRAIPPLPQVWLGTRDAPGAAGPFHVFIGGSPQRPGMLVQPASMSTLANVLDGYRLESDVDEGIRRRALADWITSPENPLSPRVLVNRLWHYHFGTGIVSTPSDFGYMGDRPSHPQLLDWLARQLVDGGWRMKRIHRLIMLSHAYRQSSQFRDDGARIDRDDRLLWRFPPRRLSAEEIRDTMLAVSGTLNRAMGGPGFRLYHYMQDNVATYAPLDTHGPQTYRRAVYHQNARAARTDLMTEFDQPDCAFSVARRAETTTPLQALTALNHAFTIDQSNALAMRVRREVGSDPRAQVHRLFLLCYGREPSAEEIAESVDLIQQYGTAALCRVLFNTSEMIYVL